MSTNDEPRLCLVLGHKAFFCYCDPTDVTGDDHEDSPAEHNAGPPYQPFETLMWHGPLDNNGLYYSADELNHMLAPWLVSQDSAFDPLVQVWAGCTTAEFRALVTQTGGSVYGLLG